MGFGVSHQIDKAELQKMSFDITTQNTLAAAALREETQKVQLATDKAIKFNNDLDASHEAYIKTAATYDQQLDSMRLYAERRPCGESAKPASNPPGVSQDSAAEAELSESLDRLVKQLAKQCDIVADYADRAYQFATLNNCGIAKESVK